MRRHRRSKVAVGLAVHNGERFLREAIDSILGQTLGDLELIIADNASTDSTQEICLGYGKADRRVRYVRNAENVGVAENFNIAFRASNSRYFRWAADDDVMEPTYLQTCVGMLDDDASLAAANSLIRYIDDSGNVTDLIEAPLECQSMTPWVRYIAFLGGQQCIWSVMRSDYVEKVRPHRAFPNSENYFLAELALMGRFGFVQEYLFNQRMYAESCTSMRLNHEEQLRWWGQRRFTSIYFTPLTGFYMQAQALWHSPVERGQKLVCLRYLAGNISEYMGAIARRNAARLMGRVKRVKTFAGAATDTGEDHEQYA